MPPSVAGPARRQQCLRYASLAAGPGKLLALLLLALALATVLTTACAPARSPTSGASGPKPLIVYTWERDIPQSVLDDFTAEFGIPIDYRTYNSSEEAYRSISQGDVYDVAAIEYRYIQPLLAAGMLSHIERAAIPNFRFISPEFRNLVFDPNNDYSIPYSWGGTGIVIRANITPDQPVTWAEPWDERYRGTVAVWRHQSRDFISATLKQLGYSANSEDPVALAAVREQLLALRPAVRIVDTSNPASYVLPVLQGQITIGIGNVEDANALALLGAPMRFYYPEEGALLWGGSFVVPATSPQPQAAAQFIDFLLRPEISARFIVDQHFRMANAAADQFVPAKLQADPLLYPPLDTLRKAELLLPLSPAGEARYQALWDEFLAAPP